MRWLPFLLAVLAGVILQTTVLQALWLPTPVGWIGPEVLAATAVFVALYARNGVEAALAGWILGMAVDLTLSGEGMGLLAILYAAATAGIFRIRRAFFREKVMTQMLLTAAFCLAVYGAWTGYELLLTSAPAADFWRRCVQTLGLSVYTALLAPLAHAAMKRMQRLLLAGPAPRNGR